MLPSSIQCRCTGNDVDRRTIWLFSFKRSQLAPDLVCLEFSGSIHSLIMEDCVEAVPTLTIRSGADIMITIFCDF
jgi:hypothetical protein